MKGAGNPSPGWEKGRDEGLSYRRRHNGTAALQ